MPTIGRPCEVEIQLVGIEWGERSQQFGHCFKASIQRLVSAELVLAHLLTPETFAIEANIPVTEVVVHKSINQSASPCGVVVVHFALHALNQ